MSQIPAFRLSAADSARLRMVLDVAEPAPRRRLRLAVVTILIVASTAIGAALWHAL